MRIVKPSFQILRMPKSEDLLKHIERCGRVCYKSEGKITEESSKKLVRALIKSGHHSVIEHDFISVLFVMDRGISHEVVRHRLSSFSQESTRYCNYSKGKFDGQITVIKPLFFEKGTINYDTWHNACIDAEYHYNYLLTNGAKPQEARSVLPNSLKTEIVVTANIREWRHIFKLRCAQAAHPQIRQLMLPLLYTLNARLDVVFEDLKEEFSAAMEAYHLNGWFAENKTTL